MFVHLQIQLKINSVQKSIKIHPRDMLLEVLRREGYYGVKRGCNTGDCGSCTVLINGVPKNSCTTFAAGCNGKEITTIEGVAEDPSVPSPGDGARKLHPIQKSMVEGGAVQCGFCTPGVILSTKALLAENPNPSAEEIKEALDGNLCRCTGYVKIIEAIQQLAR